MNITLGLSPIWKPPFSLPPILGHPFDLAVSVPPGLLRAQQLSASVSAAAAAWLHPGSEGSHGLSDQGPPGSGWWQMVFGWQMLAVFEGNIDEHSMGKYMAKYMGLS